MSRLFLRLYLLIVSSVMVVGISLDLTWQYFEPQQTQVQPTNSLLKVVATQLDSLPQKQLEAHIKQLNQNTTEQFSLISTQSEQAISIKNELALQPVIFLQNTDELLGFIPLNHHDKLLKVKSIIPPPNPLSRSVLIFLFYTLIAVSVFYWIWPLAKDLKRMEEAVNQFDQQQWQSKVRLSNSSSINHLANAYNTLLDKIKVLIETQQAMSHSISHELRTPLARIRFALQMAEESTNIDSVKLQIRSVTDDISEMNELINELLSFASLENVSTTANIERGNIRPLIETIVNRLTTNNKDKIIRIVPKKSGDKNNADQVSCDSYLMERAIQNLMVNACKFSDKQVLVSFRELTESYQVVVEDDGRGISKESRHKIFDSFVQLEGQHKNSGFGLGLAIVKRIMLLHAGNVSVETSGLGGAKFILTWPKSI